MNELRQEVDDLLEFLKMRKGINTIKVCELLGLTRTTLYGRRNSKNAGTVQSLIDSITDKFRDELKDYASKNDITKQSTTKPTSALDRLTDLEKKYIEMLEERAAREEGITKKEFQEMMNEIMERIENLLKKDK